MATTDIHFYDSASPGNIPSGVHAAVYINGFAWPVEEILRMGAVKRISVLPQSFWAKYASIIDVETGAATPEDVVPFGEVRLSHGWDDPTAYVNRSNWQAVKDRVAEHGSEALKKCIRYWVATLDGTQDIPGAWAVQYFGGLHTAYDLSVLHGKNDFHKPGVNHGPYGT